MPLEEVNAGLQQLDSDGVIALDPTTGSVWLAHPFAEGDSPFKVRTDRGDWDAICIWDALGVLALIDSDGDVSTRCPDCGDELTLSVIDGAVDGRDLIVHFGVPAAQWYLDIAHT
jgi:hypothetical protein